MSSLSLVGTFVLVHWCSGLLPPIPEDERTYYEILDVPENATTEEIRKAYKKKNLQLHPDKLQQQNSSHERKTEAAAELLLVQEAHGVLSDSKERQRYHRLAQKSPTRHRYLYGGGMAHPTQMYENLAQASCLAKSRILFLLVLGLGLVLLQPILILCKVNHILEPEGEGGALQDTDWMVILIPTWIIAILWVGLLSVLVCVISRTTPEGVTREIRSAKKLALLQLVEHVCWFTGLVLTALRWDRSLTSDYAVIFIPFYIALVVRCASALSTVAQLNDRMDRMVTPLYLNHNILEGGRPYQDLTEEEKRDLESEYVLVHVPPDFHLDVELVQQLEEDDLEALRVEASPEYESAREMQSRAMQKFWFVVLVAAPFTGLVVNKVDGGGLKDTSWWLIFLPFLISLGFRLLKSCFMCCCGTANGSEVVVLDPEDEEEEEEDENVREDDPTDEMFVSADASMRDFVKPVEGENEKEASDAVGPTSASADAAGASKSQQQPDADTTTKDVTDEPDLLVAPSDEQQQQPPQDEEAVPPNEETGEDETLPSFEEFSQAWKAAQEEAESSAVEAQARAQADCCSISWQLMLICLIVGKLDQVYEGDGAGYNAIWILFPVLVVAGCMLACCACLVYGAGESSGLDGIVNRVASTKEEDQETPAEEDEEGGKISNDSDNSPNATEEPSTASAPAAATTTTYGDTDELD